MGVTYRDSKMRKYYLNKNIGCRINGYISSLSRQSESIKRAKRTKLMYLDVDIAVEKLLSLL